MHGLSPGLSLPVNAEIKPMGGVVDCGLGVDSKTSPRRAAIEKAQAELQQEFGIREERKKELEFLEKGGNPLDFKFIHAASISVQSTSLTDQVAEPYVTSEAKGSFTLAASPHGESVESSGRPGGSVGREPNIGDNLLLLNRENNKLHGEKNAKHRSKRGSISHLEQSSHVDGCHNAKDTEDSVIFRLGAKSQAYARRNRSRTGRDCTNLGLTDSGSRHGNRASITSSYTPSPRGTKGSLLELQAQNHAASSISNPKAANPYGAVVPEALAPDDQVDMQLDMMQHNDTCPDTVMDGSPQGVEEVKITENLQGNDSYNQHSSLAEKATNGTSSQLCDIIRKDDFLSVDLISGPLEVNKSKEVTCGAENDNGHGVTDKSITSLDEDDLCHKISVADNINQNLDVDITEKNICANGTCDIHENTDGGQSLMLRKTDGSSGGDLKQTSEATTSMPDNRSLKEELTNDDDPTNPNDASRFQLNFSNSVVQLKDDGCDSRTEAQIEVMPVTNSEPVKLNGEIICEPEKKINNNLADSNCIKTSLLLSSTSGSQEAVLIKRSSASTSEIQTSTAGHKKAHEDAILKEARLIEARFKSAGELSSESKYFEKQQKCHWDFVLEEMTWMANDFMQERLWKTTAASQVSRLIASCGRGKFDQLNILRVQRNVARSLAKAVMHFWHAAEALRMGDTTPNAIHHECKLYRLSSSNFMVAEMERDQVGDLVLYVVMTVILSWITMLS
ncbi:hypothetical protein C4D60_Mb01t24050 [Musa balbisiana]|uniref:HSA domain-containing protein n=1 Tax=Musa balbisiana TaxID=52838 RepID=A0A4S8JPK3_MUSBA|nr:hypothetical protein C4D60_Mb01t24050 [Musa balbisiana]